MTTFDSLTFSERLRAAGMTDKLAKETASAVRDLVMSDLVTRADLKTELAAVEARLTLKLGAVA